MLFHQISQESEQSSNVLEITCVNRITFICKTHFNEKETGITKNVPELVLQSVVDIF